MECNIPHKLSIKRYKSNSHHVNDEFDEVDGYLYNKDGIFAICQLPEYDINKWYIVHRPSEHLFASFKKKYDAELFLDYFFEVIDESEIQYLTPLYSQVEGQFKAAFTLVHPKYWRRVKG